jgi:hypothetical protein
MIGEIEMVTHEGICRFCGLYIPVLAVDQVDANNKAEAECNCGGLAKERKHKTMLENIEKLFGEPCVQRGYSPVSAETLETIRAAAEGVFNGSVLSVSIGLGGHTATVSYGKKGAIKVARKFSSSTELETGS